MKTIKLSILRAARLAGLFHLFRYLTRSKVRILCYHGGSLGDEHRFNSLLFCRADFLNNRLQWLRDKGFSILSLERGVSLLGSDTPRPRLPTVLTFDDGWYSTYKELHPVIARHGVPATLYLCTSYFSSGQPNPDVALSYLFWNAGGRRIVVQGIDDRLDGGHDLTDKIERGRLFGAALEWLQEGSGQGSVGEKLEMLGTQFGVSAAELDLASRRFSFVSQDELLKLAAEGWSIELHGHAHHYPAGQPEVLKADLEACRVEIRNSGLPEALHYCYPSGNFDTGAHRLLADLGVISATTCLPGLLDRADEGRRYYLSRFLDGEDIHPLEFESEMSGFSDFLRRLAGRS